MDQDSLKHKKNINTRPGAANDQLGENAAMEFSQDYDNKSNQTPGTQNPAPKKQE